VRVRRARVRHRPDVDAPLDPLRERAARLLRSRAARGPEGVAAGARPCQQAIEDAAKGLGSVAKKAERADELIATYIDTGKSLGSAAHRPDDVLKEGGSEVGPTLANLRAATERFNKTFDEKTAAEATQQAQPPAPASTPAIPPIAPPPGSPVPVGSPVSGTAAATKKP